MKSLSEKAEAAIEKMKGDPNFYLAHLKDAGRGTIFGDGNIALIVPVCVGEETEKERALKIYQMVAQKYLSDEELANMVSVNLPKASEIKTARGKNPALVELRINDGSENNIAMPFYVQGFYLKAALSVAPFDAFRNSRSRYNPLYLYSQADDACAVIMPFLKISGGGE